MSATAHIHSSSSPGCWHEHPPGDNSESKVDAKNKFPNQRQHQLTNNCEGDSENIPAQKEAKNEGQ